MTAAGEVTQLLERCRDGEAEAFDLLVERVYGELRAIARGQLRRGRPGDTLSTTAVVHEAYLKLSAGERAAWKDRSHFFAVSARAMRHILVDHARRRGRDKRGGQAVPETLDEQRVVVLHEAERLLALDQALGRLEAIDPRAARVVECRYFVGLTDEETARALDTSPRSIQRLWSFARSWLAQELAGSAPSASSK